MSTIPTASNWLLTSVGSATQEVIRSTYLVLSRRSNKKGTAFALTTGVLITNEHVVNGSTAPDLEVISSTGDRLAVTSMKVDFDRDLAALELVMKPSEGFRIQTTQPSIGERVHTWGYPLAYNGPSPILSVGYLAGFNAEQRTLGSRVVKHYVVNGAFNPGNSGGPLIAAIEDGVIGVVVSKHAPMLQWHLSALEALKSQRSGFVYTAKDASGKEHTFSEAQLVGDLLQYFRDMTQVVIGEAIAASELTSFLDSNGLAWDSA